VVFLEDLANHGGELPSEVRDGRMPMAEWVYSWTINLVGGFKHDFYFPFHIWDNPSH
jgi:hypothetical protein